MRDSFDLNLVPFVRYAGREYPEFIGLHATAPPRRPARGRAADRLVLYLNLLGNAPLAPGKQRQVLADLAKRYFETPGTVTSAMRFIASQLNQVLLERNKRLAISSRQAMGILSQIVVRGKSLYLAQSGMIHFYLIKESETLEFFDPEMADHYLGQSRKTPILYYQASLEANDALLVASQPSPNWNASALKNLHGQGPESLRRRLFGHELNDIHAVLIQATAGKGELFLPRLSSLEKPVVPSRPLKSAPEETEYERQSVSDVEKTTFEESPQGKEDAQTVITPELKSPQDSPSLAARLKELEAEKPESVEDYKEFARKGTDESITAQSQPLDSNLNSSLKQLAFEKRIADFLKPIGFFLKSVMRGLGAILVKILPGEEFFSIPSTVMAFIAIVVPVTIVTVASIAYFSLGVNAQYKIAYQEAEELTLQAIHRTDSQQKRAEFEATLRLLDQAEGYRGGTLEVQTLRKEVRNMLDGLDLVVRVDYQPAIVDGLPPEVNIIRILNSNGDLYMLDSLSGSVLRAEFKGDLYYLDPNFQCGQDTSGTHPVGPLIDMISWSAGFLPEADIIALDAFGNILYCSPDKAPQLVTISPPSEEPWGDIAQAALDLGDFYVLDLLSNNAWVYWRSNFSVEPTGFSKESIPNLDDVIDMTVNRDELYLLHEDGILSLCVKTADEDSPTQCSDVPYIDFRPGREKLPMFPANPFIQIQYTPPPDPSLYLLEPQEHAIYNFSLRNLTFQKQYLPAEPFLLDEATAFSVDSLRRYLYLAVANQIFHAAMP